MFSFLRPQKQQDNDSFKGNESRSTSVSIPEDYARSRHSSIEGPYRYGESTMPFCSFPVYDPIVSASESEIYSRSLFCTGQGFAIRRVRGDLERPAAHIHSGAIIGDVLYMDYTFGTFFSCFNIFAPPGNSHQPKHLPPNFSVFSPRPTEKEIARTVAFTPGTLISSGGIKAHRTSDTPLRAEFTVDTHEGAILVLPTGAVREEVVDPSSLHSYIGQHALGWYQHLNGDSNDFRSAPYAVPNGTLWIVTSVDTASTWAMATIESPKNGRSNAKGKLTYDETNALSFNHSEMNYRPHYEYGQTSNGDLVPVFMHVLAVALTPSEWGKHIANTRPEYYTVYGPLSLPKDGLRARMERFLVRIKLLSLAPETTSAQCFLHPATLLLHILLLDSTTTSVGIVGDDVWVPHLQQRPLTQTELINLMRRVIENSEIIDSNGVIKFVPLPKTAPNRKNRSILSYITRVFPWSTFPLTKSQARALANLCQVISAGPPRRKQDSDDDISV